MSTAIELAQNTSEKIFSYSGNARSISALSWFFSDEHSSTSDMRKRARSRMPAVASSAIADGSNALKRTRSAMSSASEASVLSLRTVSTLRNASVWMGLITAAFQPCEHRKSNSAIQ